MDGYVFIIIHIHHNDFEHKRKPLHFSTNHLRFSSFYLTRFHEPLLFVMMWLSQLPLAAAVVVVMSKVIWLYRNCLKNYSLINSSSKRCLIIIKDCHRKQILFNFFVKLKLKNSATCKANRVLFIKWTKWENSGGVPFTKLTTTAVGIK